MEKYDYSYEYPDDYCYQGTDVLKNKLGIKNDDALAIVEREITSLKILKLYNMPIEAFPTDSGCRFLSPRKRLERKPHSRRTRRRGVGAESAVFGRIRPKMRPYLKYILLTLFLFFEREPVQ